MRRTWAKAQPPRIPWPKQNLSSVAPASRWLSRGSRPRTEGRGTVMAEEKTEGSGTLTEDAPGENTVQVTFLPEGKTVQFEHGKLPYEDHGKEQSLLDVALNFGITLDHACGGNCACTTCHIWVKEGAENLSPMDDDEADRLDMAADLQLNSRLGCQTVIKKPGKVVVEIPAWNRNYVSEEH